MRNFPEDYICRQVCRFAEEYLYGLALGMWIDESDELYEMIVKYDCDEHAMKHVELTKLLIDMFKGDVELSVISVKDILVHLNIEVGDLHGLVDILAADDIVSVYDRNPMKGEENDKETFFIGLNL